MTTHEDEARILTEFQVNLANATFHLDAAWNELNQVDFTRGWWIDHKDRIQAPANEALDTVHKANSLAREALAWCLLARLDTENLIKKGE